MYKSILILLIVSVTATFSQTNSGKNGAVVTGSTSGGKFEKVGSAGGQFLKIPIGGRGVGMGGAYNFSINGNNEGILPNSLNPIQPVA